MIKFRHLDGKLRVLIGEFFGEGNIILCDENMQILAILYPLEVRHRTLKVGFRYAPPPSRGVDVFNLTLEKLDSLKLEGTDLDVQRWIGRNVSMPKKFVEEVVLRAGVSKKKVGQLSYNEIEKIFATIKSMINEIVSGQNHSPIVILGTDGKPEDALPIVTNYASKLDVKKMPSYMEAVDEVLSNDIMNFGRNLKTIELGRQIAILEHDLEEQNKAKESVMAKSFSIRKVANELMVLSYSGINDYDSIQVKQMLSENSSEIINEKGAKYLQVAGERVRLDTNIPRVSSMLFARAKEMERGSLAIDEAKSKLLSEITSLRNRTESIHKKIVIRQQSTKEWYERYRWFVTGNGLLAIGGRDASSNSALIRKHLTERDLVFHAEVHGSPFFIIKNASSMTEISESLQQTAQATVSFSRAWKDGLSSADAYWVMPEQVKKGAPTGQFLPKGSFTIEGRRNYIKGVEVRLAIGVLHLNNRYTLVAGPPDVIKKQALVYAILLPGGTDPMNIAKKIKTDLIRSIEGAKYEVNKEDDLVEFIKTINLDDFVRTLPSGQSKVSFCGMGGGAAAAAAADKSDADDAYDDHAEIGDKGIFVTNPNNGSKQNEQSN